MSKHTPGPWIATFEEYRWIIDCQGEFGTKKALAVTAGFYPKHEANARLIAAAPDLLEALEKAHDLLSMWHVGVDGVVTDDLLQIRAAIDKARGDA